MLLKGFHFDADTEAGREGAREIHLVVYPALGDVRGWQTPASVPALTPGPAPGRGDSSAVAHSIGPVSQRARCGRGLDGAGLRRDVSEKLVREAVAAGLHDTQRIVAWATQKRK